MKNRKKQNSEVILSPSLEPNLPKSKAQKQPKMPCDHPQPGHHKLINARIAENCVSLYEIKIGFEAGQKNMIISKVF